MAPSVLAEPAPPGTNWSVAVAEDARSIHRILKASHPGAVDPENLEFNAILETGLGLALRRAKVATTYADWYFALNEYVAGFDDGHLGLTGYAQGNHVWRFQWPGFLTADRNGRAEVVTVADASVAPPLGARLVDCDGRSAETLAAEILGRNAGRWSLRSRRILYSPWLFVDQTNPYVDRPRTCRFEVGDALRDYRLSWRPFEGEARAMALKAAADTRYTSPIELRQMTGGGHWIGLGSFDTDPGSEAGVQLKGLQLSVDASVDALREAPILVFDLRGNNGGSSAWILGLAKSIWGENVASSRAPQAEAVDWRVSQANLDQMIAYRASLGAQPETAAWLETVIAGLQGALSRGEPLWRQIEPQTDADASSPASVPRVLAATFVFTDYDCGSACLDAVDLLTALGAVHVGQETNADTNYLETRQETLPGGRADLYLPMKVYRGRPRGSNQPAVPAHAWTGALSDTAGIEAWITAIAERRTPPAE